MPGDTVLAASCRATLMVPAQEDSGSRLFSLWVATAIFLLPEAYDHDLTLMLIPFTQLAVVGARGEASRRAITMAVLSYAVLLWWEYISLSTNELGFFAMLTAYLSAYWLAVDRPGTVTVPLRVLLSAIWQRIMPATRTACGRSIAKKVANIEWTELLFSLSGAQKEVTEDGPFMALCHLGPILFRRALRS